MDAINMFLKKKKICNCQKKIKLCFCAIAAYPLFNDSNKAIFGGAEINLYNLAIELAKKDNYEISFFVGDYGQKNQETYNNIKVKKLKYFNLQKYSKIHHKIFRYLNLFAAIICSNADIYITSSASELFGWIVFIGKIIKKKKVIYRTAHDIDCNGSITAIKSKLGLLYKFGLKNCDQIVTQTEKHKKMLLESENKDSIVIRNGFPIIDNNISVNKKNILWIGRCEVWKRPEVFIDIAGKLPDEQFLIIIPEGTEFYKSNLLQNIMGKSNISFIGYVSFFEIQRYYEEAKLFINTSEYEGFPNSFIQACLAKTPILSFKVNPDDFINRFDLGYVCNDSIEKAVDFIKNLDQQKVRYYGENAFNYIRQNHNVKDSARKYEEIITELIKVKGD